MNLEMRLVPARIGVLVVYAAFALPVTSAEKRMKLEALPAAVQKTVREQSQGATIKDISQETEHGKTVYEIELTAAGRKKDFLVGADGTLLDAELEVSLSDLPAAVRASLERSAAQGQILLVESVTKDGKLKYYEAQVKIGGRQREIKVAPDGGRVDDTK